MFLRVLMFLVLAACHRPLVADDVPKSDGKHIPSVAAIVTIYYHNSHADLLVGRLLEGENLDGTDPRPKVKLASLYVDQRHEGPGSRKDKSRDLAARHGFRLSPDIADALTLGTGKLAIDGVLLIAEHGDYPKSKTGQTIFPKRRFFDEIFKVFEASDRSVPVFCDKHLGDNWTDAKGIYETTRQLKIPLMAGSSLPVLWRAPPADVDRGAKLKEIVGTSYHSLDAYGFHALEMVQCLAEQRDGGETGIAAVQCLTGKAVWEADARGIYDRKLLDRALTHLKFTKIPVGKSVEDLVKEPVLWVIDYRDGLRVNVFTLNGAVGDWCAAWSYADNDKIDSTHFQTQEYRPFGHFGLQLRGIEQMFHTGKAAWPVERTLLTSGLLDELLISKKEGGVRRETPHLAISYRSEWRWKKPPPMPPDRPLDKQ